MEMARALSADYLGIRDKLSESPGPDDEPAIPLWWLIEGYWLKLSFLPFRLWIWSERVGIQ